MERKLQRSRIKKNNRGNLGENNIFDFESLRLTLQKGCLIKRALFCRKREKKKEKFLRADFFGLLCNSLSLRNEHSPWEDSKFVTFVNASENSFASIFVHTQVPLLCSFPVVYIYTYIQIYIPVVAIIYSLFLFFFCCPYSAPFSFVVHAELYSLQGMEFLEGFGKKKQQPNQQSNNISSVHINPLTAQSLNIHLHGIFYFLFFSLFFINIPFSLSLSLTLLTFFIQIE